MWRALTITAILVSAVSIAALPERAAQSHLAQYTIQQPLSVGEVLIASDKLADPNFAESVVLIVDQGGDGGTLGLIVNRESEVPLSKLFPNLKGGSPDRVFQGGPVSPDVGLALLRVSSKPEKSTRITEDVYFSGSKDLIEKSVRTHTPSSKFRLYLGYTGWASGQLEAEMAAGAWSIARGGPKVIFDSDPDSLWVRLSKEPRTQIAGLVLRNGWAGEPITDLRSLWTWEAASQRYPRIRNRAE
jgi:putative transcriptional regulator